jgi:hypothetical protein
MLTFFDTADGICWDWPLRGCRLAGLRALRKAVLRSCAVRKEPLWAVRTHTMNANSTALPLFAIVIDREMNILYKYAERFGERFSER